MGVCLLNVELIASTHCDVHSGPLAVLFCLKPVKSCIKEIHALFRFPLPLVGTATIFLHILKHLFCGTVIATGSRIWSGNVKRCTTKPPKRYKLHIANPDSSTDIIMWTGKSPLWAMLDHQIDLAPSVKHLDTPFRPLDVFLERYSR
jgi:hypothetical protein